MGGARAGKSMSGFIHTLTTMALTLSSSTVRSVCLSDCGLHTDNLHAVAALLAASKSLTHLDLSRNHLTYRKVSNIKYVSRRVHESKHGSYRVNERVIYNGSDTVVADASSTSVATQSLASTGSAMMDLSGVTALTRSLRVNTSLRQVRSRGQARKSYHCALCHNDHACVAPSRWQLNLGMTTVHEDGIAILAEALRVNTSLESCNFLYTKMHITTAQALCKTVDGKAISLTGIRPDDERVDLSSTPLRPSDAVLLAADLTNDAVGGQLTRLDVSNNKFEGGDSKLVKGAARGRHGLVIIGNGTM